MTQLARDLGDYRTISKLPRTLWRLLKIAFLLGLCAATLLAAESNTAVVNKPVANMYSTADDESDVVSQILRRLTSSIEH